MKTATLTIEVPDDFKKGDCLKCQYADKFFGGCKAKSLIKDLGSLDCPLEIQDECDTNEYYADCKTCKRRYECQEWRGSDTCLYESIGE